MTAPAGAVPHESSSSPTITRIARIEVLTGAWEAVLEADREDGVLAHGVARFAEDAEIRIDAIADELLAGTYRPDRLTPIPLIRPDGRTRLLHVPSVRDRVVERALLGVLTPIVDPWLGPSSYAYRPGLGVADAVQAVVRLREEGLRWVCRCDIDDCFPSIPVPLLRRKIAALLGDSELVALIGTLLARRAAAEGARAYVPGLPQGSPSSPLWANLVLADFDDSVTRAGFPLVRYSDDMVIAATDRDEAWEAMRVASDAADDLGMALGADKSDVMSFDDGFTFLGEDFGPRYPPALADHRVTDPVRKVLYLGVQGSHARINDGRVLVESTEDTQLLDVPSGLVERVVCFGGVGVSAGLRSWALSNEVDLVFLSRRGSYLGHAWPAASDHRTARLRAQLAAADDPAITVPFGRAVVTAKVRKQVVLLQRLGRRDCAEVIAQATGQMDSILAMVPDCGSRDELMGMEGAAARQYFQALGAIVPEDVRFEGRSRRPPADVINAALSYGYAILLGEAVSALCAAGLDPAIGLLHAEQDNRPSLALDLMEEFRPLIVDQVGDLGGPPPCPHRCSRPPGGPDPRSPAHQGRQGGPRRRIRTTDAATHGRRVARLLRQHAQAPVPAGRTDRGPRPPIRHDLGRPVMAVTVVIAYDVSEDRRRSRLAAVLQAYGDRIQRSVFLATIDTDTLQEIRDRAREIVDLNVDSVYFFRQCGTCWDSVGILGQATADPPEYYWAVL